MLSKELALHKFAGVFQLLNFSALHTNCSIYFLAYYLSKIGGNMKQFNLMRAVGFEVVFAVTLLGMITKAEAHAGNSSVNVIHACKGNVLGVTRIVGVNGTCSNLESAVHWDISSGSKVI